MRNRKIRSKILENGYIDETGGVLMPLSRRPSLSEFVDGVVWIQCSQLNWFLQPQITNGKDRHACLEFWVISEESGQFSRCGWPCQLKNWLSQMEDYLPNIDCIPSDSVTMWVFWQLPEYNIWQGSFLHTCLVLMEESIYFSPIQPAAAILHLQGCETTCAKKINNWTKFFFI